MGLRKAHGKGPRALACCRSNTAQGGAVPGGVDDDTQAQQFDTQAKQIQADAKDLDYSWRKIQVLEERLRLARMARYGKANETLSDLQLELLELEPGVSSEEVQAESERGPLPPSDKPEEESA